MKRKSLLELAYLGYHFCRACERIPEAEVTGEVWEPCPLCRIPALLWIPPVPRPSDYKRRPFRS